MQQLPHQFVWLMAGFVWLHTALLPSGYAQSAWEANPQVIGAIVQEDWQRVGIRLEAANPSDPAAGLIKAHALLALNRNNDALCHFLRFSTQADLEAWRRWTEVFAQQQPRVAVAHYFRGDALARLEQWDAALKAFNTALEFQPQHPLVLHARGVAYASLGALDNASENFRVAARTHTGAMLADLFASLGTYILQRKTDARFALKWFEQALKLSPEYVLALNGRGNARMLLQDWDGAAADLHAAKTRSSECLREITEVVNANVAALLEERDKAVSQALTQVAGFDPGFSLQEKISRLDTMPQVQRQRAYDVINNAAQYNRTWEGGLLQPTKTELSFSGGVKGSLIGQQPYLEGKLSATWDWTAKAEFNERQQTQLMDTMRQRYGITQANPINNLKAWASQHLLPGGHYGQLTSPQGVSSREIAAKPMDTGEWNVLTLYGLVYRVQARQTPPVQREN